MKQSTLLLIITLVIGLGAYFVSNPATQAATRLLPFQGRLTDATGTPIADGAKVVQFKIYDAPTGGTAVWNGEVQKLTVNGGLVSTLLGSKAEFSSAVDFNRPLYLEITVDANGDNAITAADPPLLPRQSILPAVFAVEAQQARTLKAGDGQHYDWSALFGNQNPSVGTIPISRVSLPNGSIAAAAITANDSIGATQLAPNAVETSELKDNAVTSGKIADGEVKRADIGLEAVGTSEIADRAVTASKLASAAVHDNLSSLSEVIGLGTSPGGPFATGGVGLAVGDGDTGLKQEGDGVFTIYTNNLPRIRARRDAGNSQGSIEFFFGGPNDMAFVLQNDHNMVLYAGGGPIWQAGTGMSDSRMKQNIRNAPFSGLGLLEQLRVVEFNWKPDSPLGGDRSTHVGFIAQEVAKVLPAAVKEITPPEHPEKSALLLDKSELVPILVKAVQEQQAELRELRRIVNDLRKRGGNRHAKHQR